MDSDDPSSFPTIVEHLFAFQFQYYEFCVKKPIWGQTEKLILLFSYFGVLWLLVGEGL